MTSEQLFVPYIQLRPFDVCIFMQYVGARRPKNPMEAAYAVMYDLVPEKKTPTNRAVYSGAFSPSARKRMLCALDVMILVNPARKVFNPIIKKEHTFQFSFITLTYSCSQIVDYKDSMKHLEYFLKWLRTQQGAKFYVWRLEIQKRGQIHFHIVSEAFVRYDTMRDKWNNIQRAAGLILRGENPNSTDIKSALSVSDVSAYCAKYMTKEDSSFHFYTGSMIKKFWGCSMNIQGVKRPTFNLEDTGGSLREFQENIVPLYAREFAPSDFSLYYSSLQRLKSKSIAVQAFRHFSLNKMFSEWKNSILAK